MIGLGENKYSKLRFNYTKLRKFVVMVLLLCFAMGLCTRAEAQAVSEKAVSAQAAVLMDVCTGQILYEKNGDKILSMASTTKVMTALLTQEYIETIGDEEVKVSKEMVSVEGSSMGLRAGDSILLSDLIVGMLLPSGNDAANAAALHISGSMELFAQAMNNKAQCIGMNNTNFVTASGLDDPEHFSTAKDMALLTAHAINNRDFLSVFSQKTASISYCGGEKQASFSNHNKLLRLYGDCIGGKTGFTKKSGRCLVSAAQRDGCRLVCVTLNAPDDWNDHMNLFETGFSKMKKQSFPLQELYLPKAEGGQIAIKLKPVEKAYIYGEKMERLVSLPKFVYASSLKKGDVLGYVDYVLDGACIERAEIRYGGASK